MSKQKKKNPKKNISRKDVKTPPFLRLSEKTKMFFARYLSILIKAGIPLHKAVKSMHDYAKGRSFRTILKIILEDLNAGRFLSDALNRFPKVFDQSFVSIVEVGERSGGLADALERVSDQMERAQELRSKVISAFIYPIILFIATLGIVIYLTVVVVPNLLPVFSSLNVELPITTRFVIAFSDILLSQWWVVLGGVILVFIIYQLLMRWERFAYARDWFILRIPVIGTIIKNVQIARFSRILSILITSGVNIVESVEITGRSLTNRVFKEEMVHIATRIGKGEFIHMELIKHDQLFPSVVLQMIEAGEKTGQLPDSLLFISDFAESEAEDSIKKLSILIEPTILVSMGFIVGFIALSVITPIYQLTTGI